jgi:hypothetical protein
METSRFRSRNQNWHAEPLINWTFETTTTHERVSWNWLAGRESVIVHLCIPFEYPAYFQPFFYQLQLMLQLIRWQKSATNRSVWKIQIILFKMRPRRPLPIKGIIAALKGVNIKSFAPLYTHPHIKWMLMFAFCCCLSGTTQCLYMFVCLFVKARGVKLVRWCVWCPWPGLISGCYCLFLIELLLRFIDVCYTEGWVSFLSWIAAKGNQFILREVSMQKMEPRWMVDSTEPFLVSFHNILFCCF